MEDKEIYQFNHEDGVAPHFYAYCYGDKIYIFEKQPLKVYHIDTFGVLRKVNNI